MLPLLFLGSVAAMATIAEGVARLFERFEPLEAYRLDITGSLAGIVVFSLMSFLGLGPFAWGLVIAGALHRLDAARGPATRLLWCGAVVFVFALGSLAPDDTWSPVLPRHGPARRRRRTDRRGGELAPAPIDDAAGARSSRSSTPGRTRTCGRPLEDVLIVGAGNGNDVALALSRDAGHIDAVEIDPVIQAAGRDLHPARPYQDPRVSPHIDDGRAYPGTDRSDL